MTEPTWAIIRARTRCEDIVAQGFLNAGYRAYVPRFRILLTPHGRHRRPTATMRALFAGLVFVQDWRGWPQERISQVIGLMPGARLGAYATLSASDIAVMMGLECSGFYEPQAPRPPANGVVLPDALSVGDEAEFDLAGELVQGTIKRLSKAGRATMTACVFGRDVEVQVDSAELRAVSA